MVHFSGRARKMNQIPPFARAKSVYIPNTFGSARGKELQKY
ncbi:MAG: hypothetical protein U5L45_25880 [Saprospiraceae bacterium]|nr:hypothetical protein [Saprospiraceae bacterium]